jgi:hypothetical protein
VEPIFLIFTAENDGFLSTATRVPLLPDAAWQEVHKSINKKDL